MAGREGGEGMSPSGWDVSQLSVGDRIGKDTLLRVRYYTACFFFSLQSIVAAALLFLSVVVVIVVGAVVGRTRRVEHDFPRTKKKLRC